MWALFDWLAQPFAIHPEGRTALMPRLAAVLRRVALTRDQIERLPDTYRAAADSQVFADRYDSARPRAFLPRDLFNPAGPALNASQSTEVEGPWVSIGGLGPVVPHHAGELSRSSFVVLWNLPGGAAETRAYLAKLWDFPQPFVPDQAMDGERRVTLNPALPALPEGTQVALVRRMLLIDDQGLIVPSNMVQSIQLRVFRGKQSFFEFRMSRESLFASKAGGLRAVGPDDVEFLTFSAKGDDPFETRGAAGTGATRQACSLASAPPCHSELEPGIRSVKSVRALLRPNAIVDSRHERWARWFTQPSVAAQAKTPAVRMGPGAGPMAGESAVKADLP